MNNGFSLIELLIVISLALILAVASIPVYGNLQVSAQLNETSAQIIQTLRIARSDSLNRINSSSHGVKFLTDRYILFQGDSYAARSSSYDREIIIDGPLVITTGLGNDEIVFSLSLGVPDNIGNITLTHSVDGTRIISVNSLGIIQEE